MADRAAPNVYRLKRNNATRRLNRERPTLTLKPAKRSCLFIEAQSRCCPQVGGAFYRADTRVFSVKWRCSHGDRDRVKVFCVADTSSRADAPCCSHIKCKARLDVAPHISRQVAHPKQGNGGVR